MVSRISRRQKVRRSSLAPGGEEVRREVVEPEERRSSQARGDEIDKHAAIQVDEGVADRHGTTTRV
jgi:hypothetical protein